MDTWQNTVPYLPTAECVKYYDANMVFSLTMTAYVWLFFSLFFSVVSPKCVHNGKEFSEGEVYRMDPCWLCQCRGGISFCSKAECAELDCENFYIPEGECCPVCIGTHIYHLFTIIFRDMAT